MPLYSRQSNAAIEDSFDRQNLAEIKGRFLALNDTRLSRAKQALHPHQRIFLDTLALLFHGNHPMMPGFVSHKTPCGVEGFKPSKTDIAQGKTLALSYCNTTVGHSNDIWSLFVMGSVGTVAHNRHSDLDIWVCHRPDLCPEGRAKLRKKCTQISHWATSKLGLDAHFFVMNHEDFHDGKQADLDEEASGTAQRFLLLDEFYRTAIYIAGRIPAWWFVPPEHATHYGAYLKRLIDQRFLRKDSVIDFGNASAIPLEEYFGAGIWQLYKAISSPYKSVLKLLLIESYLYGQGDVKTLSDCYKNAVYLGQEEVDAVDPYLMAYQHIERYLKHNQEPERIEVARRCLYLKIGRPLDGKQAKNDNWQRRLLRRLVQDWQWPDTYVASLDQHKTWSVLQVKNERNQLVHMLNLSYHALADCAKQQRVAPHISEKELLILERKLHAAFERRPGKLDWLNLDMSADLSEPHLSIVTAATPDKSIWYWQLYASNTGLDQPLKQTQSLVELILWCHSNKLVRATSTPDKPKTTWDLTHAAGLSQEQLQSLFDYVTQWAPAPRPATDNEAFKLAAVPVSALLVINADADSLEQMDSSQDWSGNRLSERNDAFNYGRSHENLVHCVDILIQNSWNEYVCHHVSGDHTLEGTLDVLFSLCMPGCHQTPPTISVKSIDANHGMLITQRLTQWLEKVNHCYYSNAYPRNTRFIYTLGKGYCSLQFKGPRHIVMQHLDRYDLYHFLGEAQRNYSHIILDHFVQRQDLLSLATKNMSDLGIQVFFQNIKDQLLCYIFDEKGSLCTCSLPASENFQALHTLHAFLRTVIQRIQPAVQAEHRLDFGVYPITFFQAQTDQKQHLQLHTKNLDLAKHPVPELKASISCNDHGHFSYDFFFKDQTFLWADYGPHIFEHVANAAMQAANPDATQSMPIYLTDVDLENYKQYVEAASRLQTCHYLRVKLDIEHKLNKTLNTS